MAPQTPPSRSYGPIADRALKLWVILTRAQAAIAAHSRADIARHELSEAEFGVLEVLYHKGPLLLGDIQRRMFVSSGGITYLVDRLAQRGLVERRDCPNDRRARYAALTEAGERYLSEIFPEHANVVAQAMSSLTAQEQGTLTALLRKLGHGAEGVLSGTPDEAASAVTTSR